MMPKKGWLGSRLWRPTNPHSLDHLKYLYNVLCKNQTVTEQNSAQLVETLRSISEILIWGDQNDSTVFDFFLEKNMLSFFLQFMRQKSGRFIIVQLLQTLNILFENIANQTSVYYLLSNNHVNSIIIHKFDFSDEEVMAYYISFLKTLSLRLNKHTVHFFYNEQTNDFPLYTEAIKFYSHSESMVRIAVRTITLNVYRVEDTSMLWYIRDKTASPYFTNLVWFIGKHVLEIDACVRQDIDHSSRDRLSGLVAEHLDHLHYLNDILMLRIEILNQVLTEHLLNHLLLPLYVYSLWKPPRSVRLQTEGRPRVSQVTSLFLLSQVFLIMHHPPLVRRLANIIFNGDMTVFVEAENMSSQTKTAKGEGRQTTQKCSMFLFSKPSESLAKTLEKNRGTGKPSKRPNYRNSPVEENESEDFPSTSSDYPGAEEKHPESADVSRQEPQGSGLKASSEDPRVVLQESQAVAEGEPGVANNDVFQAVRSKSDTQVHQGHEIQGQEQRGQEQRGQEQRGREQARENSSDEDDSGPAQEGSGSVCETQAAAYNVTDDEKLSLGAQTDIGTEAFSLENRPFLEAIFKCLESKKDDYKLLLSLCLMYAISYNEGINQELLDTVQLTTDQSTSKATYNRSLVELLIRTITCACQPSSKVRLATLGLCIKLLKSMVYRPGQCDLQDEHLAAVEGCREDATLTLRNFYKVWEKSEEIFLDMFEDEYREMKNKPLKVHVMMNDVSVLLSPTGTPLTGIDFMKRLPCGEVERARKAIQVLFHLRDLSLTLRGEEELQLPLTREDECIKVTDKLDLNNSDLIGCTIIYKDNKRERRFLVIDVLQLILVEPDNKRLGWGIVKFVGLLQDVEVSGDKDDSRCLHVTIHRPSISAHVRPTPYLNARFMFDDHIRCMAAKQRLSKGRLKARQRKMQMIAKLLEMPSHIVDAIYQPSPSPTSAPSSSRLTTPQGTPTTAPIPGRSRQVPATRPTSVIHPLLHHSPLHVTKHKSQEPDDTVKKSVFSTVDRSKAFSLAEAQSREEEQRRTPKAIKDRIAKRRGVAGVKGDKKDGKTSEDGEVEQAEEAADVSAVQVLRSTRDPDHVESGSFEAAAGGESDIALQDLSEKLNKLVTGTREIFKNKAASLEQNNEGADRQTETDEGGVGGAVRSGCDDAEDTSFISTGPAEAPAASLDSSLAADCCSSPENTASPLINRKGLAPLTLTPAPAPSVSLVNSFLLPMEQGLVTVPTTETSYVTEVMSSDCEIRSTLTELSVASDVQSIETNSNPADEMETTSHADTEGADQQETKAPATTTNMKPTADASEIHRIDDSRESSSVAIATNLDDAIPPYMSQSKTAPSMEPSEDIAAPANIYTKLEFDSGS